MNIWGFFVFVICVDEQVVYTQKRTLNANVHMNPM